jgi:hypothetical protein
MELCKVSTENLLDGAALCGIPKAGPSKSCKIIRKGKLQHPRALPFAQHSKVDIQRRRILFAGAVAAVMECFALAQTSYALLAASTHSARHATAPLFLVALTGFRGRSYRTTLSPLRRRHPPRPRAVAAAEHRLGLGKTCSGSRKQARARRRPRRGGVRRRARLGGAPGGPGPGHAGVRQPPAPAQPGASCAAPQMRPVSANRHGRAPGGPAGRGRRRPARTARPGLSRRDWMRLGPRIDSEGPRIDERARSPPPPPADRLRNPPDRRGGPSRNWP